MINIYKKANVKKIRFHNSRHTYASLLIEAYVPAKAIQERLAHAEVRITLERYIHLSYKTNQQTAKRFTTFLNKKS